MILFPNTALIFAFLPSVLAFVDARTAAARPMKSGKHLGDSDVFFVDAVGLVGAPMRRTLNESTFTGRMRRTKVEKILMLR
jgi:hypothetical protein